MSYEKHVRIAEQRKSVHELHITTITSRIVQKIKECDVYHTLICKRGDIAIPSYL